MFRLSLVVDLFHVDGKVMPIPDSPTVVLGHANEAVRAAIELLLLESGQWRIHGVANGGEAVRVALIVLPQVVILDPYLPGMDGTATIAALRAHGILSPVIALLERDDQLQSVWQERGFAASITLCDELSQVVPQIRAAWG